MSQVPVWYERKFNFGFPVDQYPNVCIRLRGTPARLEDIVRKAPRESLVRKPAGKWSAQEHAGHMLDLEPLWMARVEDFLAGREALSVADLSNRKTDEADHNARAVDEILADFRAARLRLADHIETIPPSQIARSLIHPRLKQPMRLVDHLFFVAEHDDHHLAKIWESIHE